jgi:hypothetical protein
MVNAASGMWVRRREIATLADRTMPFVVKMMAAAVGSACYRPLSILTIRGN